MYNNIYEDLEIKLKNLINNFQEQIDNIYINKIPLKLFYNIKLKDNNKDIDIKDISNFSLKNNKELIIKFNNSKYIKEINKIILNMKLDFNIKIDNNCIILNLPLNTKERKNKILRYIKNELENKKIIVRNIRNLFNNKNKNMLKNKNISKNEYNYNFNKINKITNNNIIVLEKIFKLKELEVNKI
ncbi:ribosome recycling factor [Candidatus Nardonella dryophthoridicola]|uniref:ribosome recycling factor n=1 Tax=Candidatus Nardonella dryophthoridicola TaxID=1971485 RepID=UPI001AD875B7|nr:ribosome recycling factor [Candidatus Nardonella dryophthoridicola]QTJ62818.1 ribosome recycling factor [Candidatus Nardonella dryophthoridicola]